jgi:hypothetical protein
MVMISQHFLDILKAVGAVSGGLILIAGGLKWLFRMFKRLTEINTNVQTLIDNHLPHVSNSLDAHSTALHGLKTDIRSLDTKLNAYDVRLNDIKQSVELLHSAFIQHIDSYKKRKK